MAFSIKILTLNVAGLNNPIKRCHLGKCLCIEHACLVCLQEA